MTEELDVGPGALVEECLELSRDSEFRLDLGFDCILVGGEVGGVAGEQPLRGLGCELGAVDGVADALAGERVDQAGGVADECDSPGDQRAGRIPERKVVSAQFGQRIGVERLAARVVGEFTAQRRRGGRKAAEADIAVVAFGEDPAVAAGHGAEFEADGVTLQRSPAC